MKIQKGHYVPKELITSEAIHEAVVKCFVAAGFAREDKRGCYPCEYKSAVGLCAGLDDVIYWGELDGSTKESLTLQQLFTAENGLQWPDWADRISVSGKVVAFEGLDRAQAIVGSLVDANDFVGVLATRQPREKEVNEALDKAVIELSGVLKSDYNSGYIRSGDSLRTIEVSLGEYICTVGKFTQRAKELGFIGQYRWGVEYLTNGKRPELPDDVEIDIYLDDHSESNGGWLGRDVTVGSRVWSVKIVSFKITDQRYRPADTSYLNALSQDQSLTHSEEGLTHSDWFESGDFPPAGAECEVKSSGQWHKTTVIGMNGPFCVYVSTGFEETNYNGDDDPKSFRPIRNELDKKRVVTEAQKVCVNFASNDLGRLYDAGFLRLPDQK
jgi:hypothetical protein